MNRLTGRTAIVTGAARGLGAAFARALADKGAAVCLCDIESADPVAADIRASGGEAITTIADVSKPNDAAAAIRLTEEWKGAIHILVNNAAVFASIKPRPFYEIESSEFDWVLSVNARGTFEFTKAVVPIMRRQKYGKIINMASGTVPKGSPYLLPYVASKGAIIAMTRVMARELGDDNICVNAIAPGITSTEGVMGNPDLVRTLEERVQERSIKRVQVPADLVGTAIFLASADSDFMTGQTLIVDGGLMFS